MQKKILCKILEFSKRGFGIGYYSHPNTNEQIPVEIAHTVIDDEVEAEVYKKRKRFRKGKLLQIVEPSSKRVTPKCSHVGMCGGCAWQQMDYGVQLKIKEGIVKKIFSTLKDIPEIRPIIACDTPFYYRNKMEFSFSENKAKTKFLGLMIAHASTYVFNVTECHLTNSWMSDVLNAVRTFWENSTLQAFNQNDNSGHLRTLTMRESFHSQEKMIMLTVSGNPEYALKQSDIQNFTTAVKNVLKDEPSIFLQIHQAIKGKPTEFFEMHLNGPAYITEKMSLSIGDLYFKISPTSFFQPNSSQANKLYQKALDLADVCSQDVVFDLYSGTGTLGMAFARKVKQVIGIELNAHAVCDARENLKLNHIENMQMLQGDVGKILNQKLPGPDLVIIDPPRAGLDQTALDHIKNLKPKKILYISCNPYTQVDDCKELMESDYKLKYLQPVDQFPHTYHIENIALLSLET